MVHGETVRLLSRFIILAVPKVARGGFLWDPPPLTSLSFPLRTASFPMSCGESALQHTVYVNTAVLGLVRVSGWYTPIDQRRGKGALARKNTIPAQYEQE